MSGGSKKQTVGYRYRMGLHMGLCHGPVDSVLELRVGDRTAWSGSVTSSQQVSIDAPELFGGDEKEGGVQGALDIEFGEATQTANDYLEARIGAGRPAYRGILGLVYRGGLVTSNNPYIKPWAVKVRRILQGWRGGSAWYPEKAAVGLFDPLSPDQVFTETFASGISGYTVFSGSADSFSAGSDGGPCLVFEGSAAGVLTKAIGPGPLKSVRLRFKVEAYGPDDIATFDLWDDETTSYVLTFIPTRDATVDALQRPSVMIRSTGAGLSTDIYLGEDKVPLGEWFVFTAEYNGSTGFNVSVVNEATQETFGSAFISVSTPPNIVNQVLRKQIDRGSAGRAKMANVVVTLTAIEPDVQAMNPAHIVYECLTNDEWGMGYDPSILDLASFEAAADTFHGEGLGLCIQWTRQDSIEGFIKLVLDHVGAVVVEDRRTLLIKLVPIRGDYDLETLPHFGDAQGNVISMQRLERAAVTDAINEISVSYTDAETGKTGSITVQNLAAIQAAGRTISQSRDYPGLPTIELALRTAMRDLNAATSGLARVRLTVNREGYDLVPGNVIRFSWSEDGIAEMALRVLDIDYGSLTDGRVQLDCVEDVFGLPETVYVKPQPPGWVEPSTDPEPAPAMAVFEAPYRELLQILGRGDAEALPADAGYLGAVAAQPGGYSLNYQLYTRTGADPYADAGVGDWCPTGTLQADIAPLTASVVLDAAVLLDQVEAGTIGMLGSDEDAEIVRIDSVDATTGTLVLGRGCLDTTPKPWPAGTRFWALDQFSAGAATEYVSGETVDAKVLTRTGTGLLDESLAPSASVTLAQRQARPYPPGLLRITDAVATDAAYPDQCVGELTASWAHRDRLLQDDQVIDEGEASIGPEAGTTYTVRYYLDNVLDGTESGISGTSATPYTLSGNGTARVEVEAVRDGLTSWQAAVAEFAYLTAPADPRITDSADSRITDSGDRRITD